MRDLLAAARDDLVLVYTPAYDPDANRIEWLWRAVRAAVTHNHRREAFALLLDDPQAQFARFRANPATVLAHIGSPGAAVPPPQELAHAA